MNKPAQHLRLMAGSTIGSVVEWYDFFVFATCAVLVFDKAFFPTADRYTGILLGLGTFAAGFLARPFGGAIFGLLGDRLGRKDTLVWSLMLMGSATFAMGLLPTYAQAGLLAPALLVLLRLLQGIAVGGEATGAILIVAETVPARTRGFWTSFPMTGAAFANLLATASIGLIQVWFGSTAFSEWAWRIPFLLSAVLVGLGLWMRRSLIEPPAFEALRKQQSVARNPLSESLRQWKAPMIQTLLLKAAENVVLYLFTTFFLVLVTQHLGLSRAWGLTALFWGSAIEIPIILLAAHASDVVGRRPVTAIGLLGALGAAVALFSLQPNTAYQTLMAMTVLALTCHGIALGGMSAWFTELFPARVRFSALSTSYQVASVIGGSVAPLVGTFLLDRTGTPMAVAMYAAAMIAPALLVCLICAETKGALLDATEHEPQELDSNQGRQLTSSVSA